MVGLERWHDWVKVGADAEGGRKSISLHYLSSDSPLCILLRFDTRHGPIIIINIKWVCFKWIFQRVLFSCIFSVLQFSCFFAVFISPLLSGVGKEAAVGLLVGVLDRRRKISWRNTWRLSQLSGITRSASLQLQTPPALQGLSLEALRARRQRGTLHSSQYSRGHTEQMAGHCLSWLEPNQPLEDFWRSCSHETNPCTALTCLTYIQNTTPAYSESTKYSEPFTFFTFCFVAALC